MPNWNGKTVAVFGGSFDPPTVYHYQICQFLLRLGIDELRIVPTFRQPIKGGHTSLFEHRVNMLKEMVAQLEASIPIIIDEIEAQRDGPSFTIDTLKHFAAKEPYANFLVVMGSDSLLSIDQWKDPVDIVEHFHVLSIPRDVNEPSSSAIRIYLKKGAWDLVQPDIPARVLDYIRRYNLYVA